MNKSSITTKTISLFLSIILVTGTIVLSFSSSFITAEAQAQPYYGVDNNYVKSKDTSRSSNSISLNKIKCINDNINVNGENSGDVNIGNKGLATSASSFGYGERYNDGYDNKKDKDFDCIVNNNNNNNNNEQRILPSPSPTPPTPTQPPINNNVYVVWEEDITDDNTEIFFAASYDNGRTFSPPVNISNTDVNSFDPLLTTEGNNVYVVWREEVTLDNSEIFFTSSNNNGRTFSSPANLSDNDVHSLAPQISSEGNNVYVVWYDDTTPSNSEIFIAVSNNNGATFSDPPDNLSESPLTSRDPQISSEGNNVYVVWTEVITPAQNSEIFFRASNNNGQTFSTPSDNISEKDGFSLFPQITNEGNNVYVVWQDSTFGNNEILFAESDDNGDNFDMPDNISNNADDSRIPQISSEGNNVYVVWQDATPNNDVDIFFTASNNNGQAFSFPPDNLSKTTGSSFDPKISSEGNNVYVVWEENLENVAVFFIASNDNGNTFPTPSVNLSNNEGGSLNPQISSERNNVYVVWDDNTFGPREILFKLSNNSGDNFGQTENLSKSTEDSEDPQISSSTSQENPNSEIQMTNPTQQTVSAAFQQQPVEDSSIITQGIEEDLSALAKIEKLKKQWLGLLP